MSIIPKKTKFHLSFRNKLKNYDRKLTLFKILSKLCKTKFAHFKISKKTTFQKIKFFKQVSPKNKVQNCFKPVAKKNAYVAHWPNSFKLQIKTKSLNCNQQFLHFLNCETLIFKQFFNCNQQKQLTEQISVSHQLLKQQTQQNFSKCDHAYNSCLLFGQYGICFEQNGTLSAQFIETVRLICARKLKKKGRCWLRICCQTPVTARPAETRMGKGKGAINFWQAKVVSGQMFFEFSGLSQSTIIEIFKSLIKKSPLKLKLIGA